MLSLELFSALVLDNARDGMRLADDTEGTVSSHFHRRLPVPDPWPRSTGQNWLPKVPQSASRFSFAPSVLKFYCHIFNCIFMFICPAQYLKNNFNLRVQVCLQSWNLSVTFSSVFMYLSHTFHSLPLELLLDTDWSLPIYPPCILTIFPFMF